MCSCVFNVGSCVASCLTFRLFFNFRPLATWLLMKNRVERHQQSWYLISFLTTFWHFNCLDVNTHFFFLQWNNEFYSYGHSFSYSEIRNFTAITKWLFVFFTAKFWKLFPNDRVFTAKYKILKIIPKRPFLLWLLNTKLLKMYPNNHSFHDHKMQNLKLYSNGHLIFWLQTTKIELNSFFSELWKSKLSY